MLWGVSSLDSSWNRSNEGSYDPSAFLSIESLLGRDLRPTLLEGWP